MIAAREHPSATGAGRPPSPSASDAGRIETRWRLPHPAPLIAIPSLLGISLILFTVLALAPGDPFEEMATNPNVPPEVREALRAKFGLNDPIMVRYLRWLAAMAQGDWGFSFASRIDVDQLILQRVPTTLFVVGSSQILALSIALPVGIYAATGPIRVRPDRQHARLRGLLAADLLHRPAASS